MEISNICIIGNDNRMDRAAQIFYDMGYEVYRDIDNANGHSVIILQPAISEEISKTIYESGIAGQRIYGGMLSNRFCHECELRDMMCIDYLKWDHLTAYNADLTSKGIIREAKNAGAVPEGSNCLVTGYGFCGKSLAKALDLCKAKVFVAVRRKELKSAIESLGYGYINIEEMQREDMSKFSYVFNTVPAMVLNADVLDAFSCNVMIFDIASKPGGTDFEYCREKGIYAVNSLGIPGKEFPHEAGEIIARSIIDDINLI